MAIAGRPVAMGELASIGSVSGLPNNPPGVLIRAHRDVNRSSVEEVLDELAKGGVWTVALLALNEEDLHNKAPEVTARKPAGPQR
jgi:hypothetical protein